MSLLSVIIFNIVYFSSINSVPLSTGKSWDSSGVIVSRLRRQANGFGISMTRSSAQSDSSVPASGYLTAYGLNTYGNGNYNSAFGSGSGLDNQGSRYPGSYANAQSFASSSSGVPSYGPSSANALATAGATVNSGYSQPGRYNNFYGHPYYSPMGPYQYGGLGGFGGGYGSYGGSNYGPGFGGNGGGYPPGGFNSGGMKMGRPGPQSNNVGPGPAVPPTPAGPSGSGSKAQAAGSTQVEPISPPIVAKVGTTSLGNPSVVKPDTLPGVSSANVNTEASSSPIQPPKIISNTGSAESGSEQPGPIVSLIPPNAVTNANVESNTGSSGPGDGVVGPPSSPVQGTSHADGSANGAAEGATNSQVLNPPSQPTDTTGGSPGSSADIQAKTSLQEDHRDVGSENSGGSHAETQSNAAASGNDGVSNANANAISFDDY